MTSEFNSLTGTNVNTYTYIIILTFLFTGVSLLYGYTVSI